MVWDCEKHRPSRLARRAPRKRTGASTLVAAGVRVPVRLNAIGLACQV